MRIDAAPDGTAAEMRSPSRFIYGCPKFIPYHITRPTSVLVLDASLTALRVVWLRIGSRKKAIERFGFNSFLACCRYCSASRRTDCQPGDVDIVDTL